MSGQSQTVFAGAQSWALSAAKEALNVATWAILMAFFSYVTLMIAFFLQFDFSSAKSIEQVQEFARYMLAKVSFLSVLLAAFARYSWRSYRGDFD